MKIKLKSAISSFVIGGLLLTCGGIAFASNTDVNISTNQKPGISQADGMNPGRIGGPMGKDGQGAMKHGEKPSPLKKLVDGGTLTQAQADAVAKVLFPEPPQAGQPNGAEANTSK